MANKRAKAVSHRDAHPCHACSGLPRSCLLACHVLRGDNLMTDAPAGKRDLAPRYSDPFSSLRAEMDSLFDSFMSGLPAFPAMFGTSGDRGFALTPQMDVRETDKEIVVEAELPGIDE